MTDHPDARTVNPGQAITYHATGGHVHFVHNSLPPPRPAQPPPHGTAAWRSAAVRAVLLEQDIVTRALLSEAEIDRLVDGMSMRLDGAETASESASSAMLQEMAEARDILVDALVFAGRIPPEPRPLVYMAREAAVMLSCLRPASADSPTASVRATSGDTIRAADEAIRAAQGRWQSNEPPTPPVQRDDRVRRNWAAREGKPVPPPCQKSPDCVAPPHSGNCVTAAQIDAWAAESPARARYDASDPDGRSGSLARLRSLPVSLAPGDTWRDPQGTPYDVVRREDVGDRPRWWLLADARPDRLWMPGKEHLHRLPAADAATMALVARDIDRAATVLDVLRSPEGRAAIVECMSHPPQRMPDGTWREPTPGTTARPGDIIRHRDGRPGGEVHRVDGDTLWLRQEGGGGYEAVLAVDVEVVRPALGRDGAR